MAIFEKVVEKVESDTAPYRLYHSDKSHTRIIQSLSFSDNEELVATGGKDKRVKIHSVKDKKVICTKMFENSITAVAFAPAKVSSSQFVVIGFEDGNIEVHQFNEETN